MRDRLLSVDLRKVSTLAPLTHQGRIIYALKISDNVATDEDEPEVLLSATITRASSSPS